jgi:hypothetical protein
MKKLICIAMLWVVGVGIFAQVPLQLLNGDEYLSFDRQTQEAFIGGLLVGVWWMLSNNALHETEPENAARLEAGIAAYLGNNLTITEINNLVVAAYLSRRYSVQVPVFGVLVEEALRLTRSTQNGY